MVHRAPVPARHIAASAMKNMDVCPAHPRITLSRQVVSGPPGVARAPLSCSTNIGIEATGRVDSQCGSWSSSSPSAPEADPPVGVED
eukprot:COSAG02_NODE_12553_length_1526_cov_3.839385_4_plen_86_part_01